MISKNLISLTCSSLFILSLQYSFQISNANCTPSSCGLLRNISFPFRLNNDPTNCGDPKFELECENDVASIHLSSRKYYVKAIDYSYYSMRVADVSINSSSSICSFPNSSTFDYPYPFEDRGNRPIELISYQQPLHNSSGFTRVTACGKGGGYTYIKVGDLFVRDMEYMCTLEAVALTSWNFDPNNASLSVSEIHQSLLHGFNVSWITFECRHCKSGCFVGPDLPAICDQPHYDLYYYWGEVRRLFRLPQGPSAWILMIFMLLVGVSIPLKIIFGFVAPYWLLKPYWYTDSEYTNRIIVVSFGVRFIIGFLCAMCFLIYKFRRRRMSVYDEIEGYLQSDNKLTPIRYSYSDLKKMTRGFREKLGEGGFGSVYRGKLRSGHHVAVKLLGKGSTKGQDFINEIGSIGRIHHVNVVKLVGYCAERSKRALVFDFMPNGSLDKYIFNHEKTHPLDWDTKFKIATGVARGIEYLHRGCDVQILHFDIKPHNILLDENFVPKVSDFGLAKLCSIEKDNVTLTAARGTIGYVAPELISRSIGAVSYKADVYSFGMLLMEMVGLNRGLKGNNDDSTKYFPQWIYESINQGKDNEIGKTEVSNCNDENESTKSLYRKMTIVALWCIQMSPDDRPSMNKVLEMLEADVESLQIPKYTSSQSSHINHMRVNEEESWDTGATDSASLLYFITTPPALRLVLLESLFSHLISNIRFPSIYSSYSLCPVQDDTFILNTIIKDGVFRNLSVYISYLV